MSDKIFVFGHQKPDTDAIASSYGFSYLSNHRPVGALNTECFALGTPMKKHNLLWTILVWKHHVL